MSRFGDRIQAEIVKRGWSWKEAERELDLSMSALWNMTHYRSNPTILTICVIAKGLGVSPRELCELAIRDIQEEQIC